MRESWPATSTTSSSPLDLGDWPAASSWAAIGDGNLWLAAQNFRSLSAPDAPQAPALRTTAPPSQKSPLPMPRKLCVFDLDNTLITTLVENPRKLARHAAKHHHSLHIDHVSLVSGGTAQGLVVARPGAIELLKSLHATCDVALFTASSESSAGPKVAWLERLCGRAFSHKLFRSSTIACNSTAVKDLSIFLQPAFPFRTLADIILVEDCVFAGARQPENVCPITHWMGDPSDDALTHLKDFLVPILQPSAPDVRPALRVAFRLAQRMARVSTSHGGCAALLASQLSETPYPYSPLLGGGPPAEPAPGCPEGCTCRFPLEHSILVKVHARLERERAMRCSPTTPNTSPSLSKRPRSETSEDTKGTTAAVDEEKENDVARLDSMVPLVVD